MLGGPLRQQLDVRTGPGQPPATPACPASSTPHGNRSDRSSSDSAPYRKPHHDPPRLHDVPAPIALPSPASATPYLSPSQSRTLPLNHVAQFAQVPAPTPRSFPSPACAQRTPATPRSHASNTAPPSPTTRLDQNSYESHS